MSEGPPGTHAGPSDGLAFVLLEMSRFLPQGYVSTGFISPFCWLSCKCTPLSDLVEFNGNNM